MSDEQDAFRLRKIEVGVVVAIVGLAAAGVFKAGQIDGRLSVIETLISQPTNIPEVREMRVILDSLVAAGDDAPRDRGPVAIAYPAEGDTVGRVLAVRGTMDTASVELRLRVVVWSQATSRFYPQEVDATPEVDGDWTAQTAVGGFRSRGEQFDILVVEMTPEVEASFRPYLAEWAGRPDPPGLAALPGGSRIWDRVTVFRGS